MAAILRSMDAALLQDPTFPRLASRPFLPCTIQTSRENFANNFTESNGPGLAPASSVCYLSEAADCGPDQSASRRKTLLRRTGSAQVLGVLDEHAAIDESPLKRHSLSSLDAVRTGDPTFPNTSFPGAWFTPWDCTNQPC
jgi:hypothetical protein